MSEPAKLTHSSRVLQFQIGEAWNGPRPFAVQFNYGNANRSAFIRGIRSEKSKSNDDHPGSAGENYAEEKEA
jgi:hypothetical protein